MITIGERRIIPVVSFGIKEAARKLVSRERYQRGCIQKVGKRRRVWKLHWFVYLTPPGPGAKEVRRHRSKTLDCQYYSKADAWKKLEEIIRLECRNGEVRHDDGITVEEFYRQVFLPTRTWAGNTQRNNECTWRNHVAPFFGTMRIGDVRRHHVDSFYQTKVGLGASTLVQVRNAVVTVFQYAEENGYFKVPLPMPKIRLKKLAKAGGKTKVLTFEQAKTVCHMTGEHGLVYRLLMYGGIRIGELLALRVSDVKETTLIIDESVESGSKLKGTKGGETREIPLPAALRSEIVARCEDLGLADADFVFGSRNGAERWVSRQAAGERWLEPAQKESGIEWLDFHCIRRTCATLLKDRGYAQTKDIQDMLGHAAEATTNKFYIKPVKESQHRAVSQWYEDMQGAAVQ